MPLTDDTLRRLARIRAPSGLIPEVLTQPLVHPVQAVQAVQPVSIGGPIEPTVADEDGGGLWSKVKGFFDRDPDSTTDQELSAAGWAGAAGAAAQTANDWRASPVQVLSNALAGYNTARYRAQEGLRGREHEEEILGLRERGLEGQEATADLAERRFAAQQAQVQAAKGAVEGLPEGPQKENARRLLALGETNELAKMINPDDALRGASGADRLALPATIPGAVPSDVPLIGSGAVEPAPKRRSAGAKTSVQLAESEASKKQQEKFESSISARNDMQSATNRMRDLLAQSGGTGAMTGDVATKMRLVTSDIITAIGSAQNAGVLQVGDIERLTKLVTDPTSLMGYLGNWTGLNPLTSALDELDLKVKTGVMNRGREIGLPVFYSEEEAQAGVGSLPSGAKFIGPDGIKYTKAK